MKSRRVLRPVELLAAILLLASLCLPAAAQTRIVAIGDVHGAFPEFESILKETGILDAKRGAGGGWRGGTTVFVQLGDLVDRGPKTRACLDLVMELERTTEKAKGQKGKVVALLGNHEVMAMTGDLRYVSPEDYQSFASGQSEKIRQNAYREYLSYVASRSETGAPEAQDKWMAGHPLGFFERRDAFGPQGVYGGWLRQHDVVYQSGDVAFVHGGLSPQLGFDDIKALNKQMRSAISGFDSEWQALAKAGVIWQYMTFDEAVLEVQKERAALPMRETENKKLQEDLEKFVQVATWLVSDDNPTWYRGLAADPEQALGPRVDAMLARLKINYIVAGHTVLAGFQIRQRFGNRIFLIDTGMLKSVFGGKASALEIQGGSFLAHSLDGPPQALAPRNNPGTPSAAPGAAGGAAQP